MTPRINNRKAKRTDTDFVRMYYEHQYNRMAKQEEYRLTITNYVLTLSALAFTFGYQNVSNLTIVNGVVLPIIIAFANLFAVATINRTQQFGDIHQQRAHEILERYAPELKEINEHHKLVRKGIWGGRAKSQKRIHGLLVLTTVIPILVYLYQIYW